MVRGLTGETGATALMHVDQELKQEPGIVQTQLPCMGDQIVQSLTQSHKVKFVQVRVQVSTTIYIDTNKTILEVNI